jgi:hypothetical protein
LSQSCQMGRPPDVMESRGWFRTEGSGLPLPNVSVWGLAPSASRTRTLFWATLFT